jgi:transcriptional regulator with XRE-family HTH domain
MEIKVKEILKKNNSTQEDFANYLGLDRVSLNKNINHAKKTRQSMIDSLKMFIAQKRGIRFEIDL